VLMCGGVPFACSDGGYFGTIYTVRGVLPKAEVRSFHPLREGYTTRTWIDLDSFS